MGSSGETKEIIYYKSNIMEDPLSALIRKTHKQTIPLTSAEQTFHDWYIRNPENSKKREAAYTMKNMGEFMQPFGGPYSETEVERDKKFIREQREKNGHMYKTERAEILEVIFENWAKKGKWFGENCEIIPTLEFDDRANHTDFVLEFKELNGEIVRLAVDCATSGDQRVLSSKAYYTAKGIEENYLTKIKYFKSPHTKEKREINSIPRAIVVVENDKIDELCKSALLAIGKNDDRELRNSYIQYFLLAEIKSQLEAQLSLIKSGEVNKTRNFGTMQRNITNVVKIFNNLLKQKESSLAPNVVQRAKKEIEESRAFKHLNLLSRKGSRELRQ
jgi:hypothetical protein